jgi:hypothetical protein
MHVSRYSDEDTEAWDALVARAPMGTFLHTRRFLAYHGDRFDDVSAVIRNERDEVLGVFPAAVDPADERRVISHPGITFGGVLHDGELAGESMIEALESLKTFYAARGMTTLRYKAVPSIYQRRPASDDLYALFRLHGVRSRCDLSCAIDLDNRGERSSRRKRSLAKALKSGVEVTDGAPHVGELWNVIEGNLERKLGEKPVHSAEEIERLHALFPENIAFAVARLGGRTIAGVALFSSGTVMRAQYIASSPDGYDVSALDAVFEHAIARAREDGRRYFDFGTSNRSDGRSLSTSVYQFKLEFGGGGVVHEFYDLELNA